MIEGLLVRDNFLPYADAVREIGLRAPFIDWAAPDGEVYKRVCIGDIPGVQDAIESVAGPVDMLGMGFRLNFAGELPNAAIHADTGWGTHALVLYLCDGQGGTAFWQHKKAGAVRISAGDDALLGQVQDDWNREEAWRMRGMVPVKFNRAAIYDSTLFHSRFPFAAFGDNPKNGRLIVVAFFNPRNGS